MVSRFLVALDIAGQSNDKRSHSLARQSGRVRSPFSIDCAKRANLIHSQHTTTIPGLDGIPITLYVIKNAHNTFLD